jgi:hypothetical protein
MDASNGEDDRTNIAQESGARKRKYNFRTFWPDHITVRSDYDGAIALPIRGQTALGPSDLNHRR